MNTVHCPQCDKALTLWEGYKVLNLKSFICPQCDTVLEPVWTTKKRPFWQRRLVVLAWSFPALLSMTVVWIEPQLWLWLMLGLIAFHAVALMIICFGGYYQVKPKS